MDAADLDVDAAVERTRARILDEQKDGKVHDDLENDGDPVVFARRVQRNQARRQASPAPTVPSAPASEIDFKGEHAHLVKKVLQATAEIDASAQKDWHMKHGATHWIEKRKPRTTVSTLPLQHHPDKTHKPIEAQNPSATFGSAPRFASKSAPGGSSTGFNLGKDKKREEKDRGNKSVETGVRVSKLYGATDPTGAAMSPRKHDRQCEETAGTAGALSFSSVVEVQGVSQWLSRRQEKPPDIPLEDTHHGSIVDFKMRSGSEAAAAAASMTVSNPGVASTSAPSSSSISASASYIPRLKKGEKGMVWTPAPMNRAPNEKAIPSASFDHTGRADLWKDHMPEDHSEPKSTERRGKLSPRAGWTNVRWSVISAKRVGIEDAENHRTQSRDLYGMTEEEKDNLRAIRQQLLREKAEQAVEKNRPRTENRRWRSKVKPAPVKRLQSIARAESPEVQLRPKLAVSAHAKQNEGATTAFVATPRPNKLFPNARDDEIPSQLPLRGTDPLLDTVDVDKNTGFSNDAQIDARGVETAGDIAAMAPGITASQVGGGEGYNSAVTNSLFSEHGPKFGREASSRDPVIWDGLRCYTSRQASLVPPACWRRWHHNNCACRQGARLLA
eukprot:SAG31_NODE_18_length_35375_cov_22.525315_13_plen_615_part_00